MAFSGVYAVLTGDIVDSSGLQGFSEQPVSKLIADAGERVRGYFQTAVHAQIDIFRGDSWQMVVCQPGLSVRIGLYLRSLLRAIYRIDSRVSIGFGQVDHLPGENISTGTGPAFTLSGQGLERCLKPIRMNLTFPPRLPGREGEGLNTITRLIDLQAGRWTPGQAQAVAGAFTGLTQAEIAAGWQPAPVSQQAISQHLENAGWAQIKDALAYLEEALPAFLAT